jgi:hypothetical protein
MDDAVAESLVLDLLEWVANRERSFEEVMDAWRTSCPRLPVWCIVRITSSGLALLEQRRPSPRPEVWRNQPAKTVRPHPRQV